MPRASWPRTQALHEAGAAQLAALESERARVNRFWHYFKRRALERRIHGAQAAARAAAEHRWRRRRRLSRRSSDEPLPEFPGLSLAARRAINIAAIAYAEVLCLRRGVAEDPARGAGARCDGKRARGATSYGAPKECVLLMGQIQRAQR